MDGVSIQGEATKGKAEAFRWGRCIRRLIRAFVWLAFVAMAVVLLTGCSDHVHQPSPGELAEFEMAGPTGPSVDMDRVARARISMGPYRVVPGDTLQLEMLSVFDAQALRDVAGAGRQEFRYRVDDSGVILLPVVGRFPVAGQSLAEIEANVVSAFHPKYVKVPFPVHATVIEYDTRRVSIVGAVAKPGIYALRHDEMSLVALLMQAGGIAEKGAAVIRITRDKKAVSQVNAIRVFPAAFFDARGESPAPRSIVERTSNANPSQDAATLILPVKGLNIPFADVALEEGDNVVVEWPQEQYVSVVGLVNRPGNFPYPPTTRYTLVQAVASAGGLDLVADPRYVSVYRLQSDGTVVRATVQLVNPKEHDRLTDALAMALRPGDIVSVEHTLRTRANVFFERIFRINLGLYVNPDTIWRND